MTDNVFDLDALAVEETGEPFRFKFGGDIYELPRVFDVRLTSHLASGDWGAALRVLLGDEQWEKMLAATGTLNYPHAQALITAYTGYLGTSPGKSPRSTSSSNGTAKPSKRTSKGSTRRPSVA